MARGNTKLCPYTFQTSRKGENCTGCRLGGLCPLEGAKRIFCSRRKQHDISKKNTERIEIAVTAHTTNMIHRADVEKKFAVPLS